MSFKESWQQQRHQRQQEIMQRQQVVQQELAIARQERQIKAAQLHADLSLFREKIIAENHARRAESQKFQVELQRSCEQLKTEVQSLLSVARDRRQAQAQELAQQLDTFVLQIQQETAQCLSIATAERMLMAQQLKKDLSTFVEALRTDTQSFLWEMGIGHQERARQVQQELAQNRTIRKIEAAELRSKLRRFCADLRKEVWGGEPFTSAHSVTVSNSEARSNAADNACASAPSIAALKSIGAFQYGDAVAVIPAKSTQPLSKEGIAYEKEVYNFIHQAQGARLTQIESSLSINRFQAVDALRALIKKGLITQRDRIYLTQEQISHA
ncbi:hypothetical protein [Leptothermofonsia sp. ETS-13]|uniref:hypothetical protein n=1 Tax=Leptothermofonsia sp. ETS-13 TaxID=3035696 RepID=UPI003BA2A88C